MINNATNKTSLPSYFPMLVISFVTAILSSCILSPMYTQISSDVTLMYTLLPIVIDYVIIIFDIIYISLLFAIISCATYSYLKTNEEKNLVLYLTGAVIFLKHILNLTVSSIIDNYIDVTFDIPLTIILILFDFITLLVVRVIAIKKCKKHFEYAKKMEKASKYLDNIIYDEEAEVYPFGSLLKIKNPIINPIFIGIIISVSILILQRLYADFVMLGLPTSLFEVIEIIVSYLSDILLGIVGYISAYYAAVYYFIKKTN